MPLLYLQTGIITTQGWDPLLTALVGAEQGKYFPCHRDSLTMAIPTAHFRLIPAVTNSRSTQSSRLGRTEGLEWPRRVRREQRWRRLSQRRSDRRLRQTVVTAVGREAPWPRLVDTDWLLCHRRRLAARDRQEMCSITQYLFKVSAQFKVLLLLHSTGINV